MHVGLFDTEWRGHNTPYARLIARYLLDAGHRVTFYTTSDNERTATFPDHDSFDVEYVSSLAEQVQMPTPTDKLAEALQLRQALSAAGTAGVDVFHTLCLDYSEAALWLSTRLKPKMVVVGSLHRDHFPSPGDESRPFDPDRVNRWALDRCLGSGPLSTVFVHADVIATRLRESVPSADPSAVHMVPCPTPDPPANMSRTDARRKLGLPTSEPLLLFFGGMRREKGPDILLDALRNFPAPVTVVFAGRPAAFGSADLRTFTECDDGKATVVDRASFVPEDDVYRYFVAADALVLPYRRRTGISGPLRRACLTETHLISSDDSDIGSIVERNDLGQTFERGSPESLRETILAYLRNQGQYPADGLARFGRSRHWRRAGATFEQRYQLLLERDGQS